jgi:hypothetical protein
MAPSRMVSISSTGNTRRATGTGLPILFCALLPHEKTSNLKDFSIGQGSASRAEDLSRGG